MQRIKDWADSNALEMTTRDMLSIGKQLDIDIIVINTVLGSVIFTTGCPFNRHEEGGEVFILYHLAWVDGLWCEDVRINVRHVVMTRKLIAN